MFQSKEERNQSVGFNILARKADVQFVVLSYVLQSALIKGHVFLQTSIY